MESPICSSSLPPPLPLPSSLNSSSTGSAGSIPGNSTSSSQILPPLSIGSGNYDRAWNDPPVFSLEVNGMGKPVPTKLNKRVAYPGISSTTIPSIGDGGIVTNTPVPLLRPPLCRIDNSTSGTGVSQLSNLPPMILIPPTKVDFIPSFPSPGSTPEDEDTQRQGTTSSITTVDVTMSQIEMKTRIEVMKILEEALSDGIHLDSNIEAEVKKRLEILDSKWDSLPSEVQLKLNELGNWLEKRDYKRAETIQLSLSAEFMYHCAPWIMGLKKIIRKNL